MASIEAEAETPAGEEGSETLEGTEGTGAATAETRPPGEALGSHSHIVKSRQQKKKLQPSCAFYLLAIHVFFVMSFLCVCVCVCVLFRKSDLNH